MLQLQIMVDEHAYVAIHSVMDRGNSSMYTITLNVLRYGVCQSLSKSCSEVYVAPVDD